MSALTLKLIACICMLLDHIGYCIPTLLPLRVIGRLAFPIYVFLLTEGFRHTSSRPRYALRLAVFALISQPAFGLFSRKDVWYPVGSVMVTLLAAFLCLWLIETCRRNHVLRVLSWAAVLGVCAVFHLELIQSDYGARGILLALSFYGLRSAEDRNAPRDRAVRMLALLFCAAVIVFYQPLLNNGIQLIKYVAGRSARFKALNEWSRIQAFSLFAIPLTLAYNGTRGPVPSSRFGRKLLQYAFYLFYPVHMMILYWTIR